MYFSRYADISYFGSDAVVHSLTSNHGAIAIDYYQDYLYYLDFLGSSLGRVHIPTGTSATLVSGLHEPINLRIDRSTGKIYFLEGGTSNGFFKDRTLKVMDISQLPIGLVEETSALAPVIFPNPLMGGTLHITNIEEGARVTIRNVQGQAVLKGKIDSSGIIDLSNLADGFYQVNIVNEQGQFFEHALIKQ